jgi:hypothetical protein
MKSLVSGISRPDRVRISCPPANEILNSPLDLRDANPKASHDWKARQEKRIVEKLHNNPKHNFLIIHPPHFYTPQLYGQSKSME